MQALIKANNIGQRDIYVQCDHEKYGPVIGYVRPGANVSVSFADPALALQIVDLVRGLKVFICCS